MRNFPSTTHARNIVTRLLWSTLAAAAIGLSGCASMRVVSSEPPVKTIVLDKPQEFKFGLGLTKLTMPAGEYRPALEDKYGYYYQAPSKLAARDIFSYIADGGLIVKRGEKRPSKWYAIDNANYVKTGNLPENFSSRSVE
jgi:hypothetical protein